MKEKYKLNPYLKSKKEIAEYAKNTKDTLGLTIYTDEIKKITLGDYTSYTMRVSKADNNQAKESTTFYNLTIEEKNGESNIFATKYVPTQSWLNNTNQPFLGSINSMDASDLTDVFDDGSGDEVNDNNFGGTNFNTTQGSPYYPTNCSGQVIITIERIPYKCSCEDHWPWESCTCGVMGSGTPPGYYDVPYYYCEADYTNTNNTGVNNPDNPNTTGGGSGSGVSNPDPDDSSITVILGPDDECKLPKERRKYDLDGNCELDHYETCLMNNNSDEICDCVKNGGDLKDCKTGCADLNMVTKSSLVKTRLNQLKLASGNFEKGLRIDRNPATGEYVPSAILDKNNGRNEIKITPRIYTTAIAHTHPQASVKYKMFSAPDILKMAEMANRIQTKSNNPISALETSHILIFKNDSGEYRTYALRFDDNTAINNLQNIYNNIRLRNKFLKRLKLKYTSDIFKQQKHLFSLFNEFDLNISLYEADYDSNGLVNNWKKINKNNLNKEPCK